MYQYVGRKEGRGREEGEKGKTFPQSSRKEGGVD